MSNEKVHRPLYKDNSLPLEIQTIISSFHALATKQPPPQAQTMGARTNPISESLISFYRETNFLLYVTIHILWYMRTRVCIFF